MPMTPEERQAYARRYNREVREGKRKPKPYANRRKDYVDEAVRTVGLGIHEQGARPDRTKAIYDPARDGPATWATPYGQLLGDPPIGRRAIDEGKR